MVLNLLVFNLFVFLAIHKMMCVQAANSLNVVVLLGQCENSGHKMRNKVNNT